MTARDSGSLKRREVTADEKLPAFMPQRFLSPKTRYSEKSKNSSRHYHINSSKPHEHTIYDKSQSTPPLLQMRTFLVSPIQSAPCFFIVHPHS